jgi:hypothetical protein
VTIAKRDLNPCFIYCALVKVNNSWNNVNSTSANLSSICCKITRIWILPVGNDKLTESHEIKTTVDCTAHVPPMHPENLSRRYPLCSRLGIFGRKDTLGPQIQQRLREELSSFMPKPIGYGRRRLYIDTGTSDLSRIGRWYAMVRASSCYSGKDEASL